MIDDVCEEIKVVRSSKELVTPKLFEIWCTDHRCQMTFEIPSRNFPKLDCQPTTTVQHGFQTITKASEVASMPKHSLQWQWHLTLPVKGNAIQTRDLTRSQS
jgi:hypothetical protein